MAGWLIERLKGNTREHHREADAIAGLFGHENGPLMLAAASVHLPEVLVCHGIAGAEAWIDLPFGIL